MSQEEEWRLSDAERYNDYFRKSIRHCNSEEQIDRLLNPLEKKDEPDRPYSDNGK